MADRDRLDQVAVRGISARGHHGVDQGERREGQLFVVDVVLHLDARPAAKADDLSRTVDYGVVADRVVDAIEGDPVDLIETLAQRVADTCLTEPLVRQVDVTVHKPEAPVHAQVSDIAVTIHRSRPI